MQLLAEHTGIEPVIFAVTGRRVNRYTNAPLVMHQLLPYQNHQNHQKSRRVVYFVLLLLWCPQMDLNHQPTDYKSVALPTELTAHNNLWRSLGESNPSFMDENHVS